jgi:hypothetical protein
MGSEHSAESLTPNNVELTHSQVVGGGDTQNHTENNAGHTLSIYTQRRRTVVAVHSGGEQHSPYTKTSKTKPISPHTLEERTTLTAHSDCVAGKQAQNMTAL